MSAVRTVPIASIEVPKKWRSLKKKTVAELILSFEQDGLLHPIGLRHGAKPGSYILVYGKHRLEAAKRSGWPEIEAKVHEFDDLGAASATSAENLFRNNLPAGDKILATRSWSERYVAAHPEVHAQGVAGGLARGAQKQADAGVVAAGDRPTVKSFAVAAAEQTGLSVSQIREYVRVGSNLTDEEIGVLAERDVPLEVIKRINQLPAAQKDRAVAAIASGAGGHEAVAQATVPANATVEQVGDPAEASRTEADLDDDEWLDTYCGEVLDRLKYPVAYRADALLYRRIQDARQKFKNATKRFLKQSKAPVAGEYHFLVCRFLNVDHPSAWLPCGPCGGSGMSGDKSTCGFCHGRAYSVKNGGRTR